MAGVAKVKYRIGPIMAFCLVSVALVCDMVQFLLTITGLLIILADLITFFATAIFAIWFFLIDHKIFGGRGAAKKMAIELCTSISELVPIVDALPLFTVGVIAFIQTTRSEDRHTHTLREAARAKQEAAQKANAQNAAFAARQRQIDKLAQLGQQPAIPSSAAEDVTEEEPEAVY